MKLKRRTFLKILGLTGAGLLAGCSKPEGEIEEIEEAAVHYKLVGASEYTSICTFCSCSCSMICYEKDGKLINLEGDPDSIINEGALCSKGAAMSAIPNSDQRVQTPLYRAPGSDAWEEISWDEAIEKVANKIKETRDNNWIAEETIGGKTYKVNRTDAISFLGGAQNNNEECYLLSKMSRLLGTAFVEHQARV